MARSQAKGSENFDLNSKQFVAIREKMLRNESLDQCLSCDIEEKSEIESYRQYANWRFPAGQNPSAFVAHDDIQYIEQFLGRSCNLKCVTCGSQNSTKWDYDSNILNLEIPNRPPISIDYKNYPNLKAIKLLGGEPFLNSQHVEDLNLISEPTLANLELIYFTNATIRPSQELIDRWRRAGRVVIKLSVDATGDLNDYIRFPSAWENVEETAQFLRDLASRFKNIEVGVHTTVSLFNIFNLLDLQSWFDSFSDFPTPRSIRLRYNLLHSPSYLSPANLPEKETNLILEKYRGYGGQLAEIAKAAGQQKRIFELERSRRFIADLELIRKNSIGDIVPELNEILWSKPHFQERHN